TTLTFNYGTLNPNTTYYIRVGSLWNGSTDYALTAPQSTSTLTNLINPSVLSVSSTTVQAGWAAFAVGPGTSTAEGYELDVSTYANFSLLAGSSVTAIVTVSTLTVPNLTPYTTYYVRAGAIN